jgi:hypothetical protein
MTSYGERLTLPQPRETPAVAVGADHAYELEDQLHTSRRGPGLAGCVVLLYLLLGYAMQGSSLLSCKEEMS